YLIINYVGGRSLIDIEYGTDRTSPNFHYYTDFGPSPREIYADITIKDRSYEELRSSIDRLTSELYRTEDVEIKFDDEPEYVYFGRFSEYEEDIEQSKVAKLRIYFYCVDRYKYGNEQFQSLVSTIANEGTIDAYPVFDLTVKKDTDMIYIGNYNDRNEFGDHRGIALGSSVDIDEETEPRKRLIMHDTMQSTSGWT